MIKMCCARPMLRSTISGVICQLHLKVCAKLLNLHQNFKMVCQRCSIKVTVLFFPVFIHCPLNTTCCSERGQDHSLAISYARSSFHLASLAALNTKTKSLLSIYRKTVFYHLDNSGFFSQPMSIITSLNSAPLFWIFLTI